MQDKLVIDGAQVLGNWNVMALLKSRPFLWLVLAAPGALMLLRWGLTPQDYGYGHAIAESGDWAAWLLLVTLAVTPLRLAIPQGGMGAMVDAQTARYRGCKFCLRDGAHDYLSVAQGFV